MFSAAAAASFLFVLAPAARAACGTASSSPCPSPIPQNAFLSLDVTDGGPNTQITVNGGAFLANEQMTLIWDQPNKVAGGAVADGSGNFVTHVKPFTGDTPGQHKLCASVEPRPCANFTLEAAATTPSPSPSPSESPSPSPEATASTTPSPSPVGATLNGLDLISKPPFVFLPIVGGLAILLSLGYWAVSMIRRPRTPTPLPSAAVVHRATRPDYTAGFGTPPPAPAPAVSSQSAWSEPVHPLIAPAPAPAPAPEPPAAPPQPPEAPEPELPHVEWGPPGEWGPGTPDAGYPELSAPDEPPETGGPEPGEPGPYRGPAAPEHGDLPEPGD
jgi:hypothetical protein